MSRLKARHPTLDDRGPIFSVRFIVAIALFVVGVAWVAYYYAGPHNGHHLGLGLGWATHLHGWNYLFGFVLLMVGIASAATPETPLGRGRGVVVSMLTCFGVGLAWIVVYYIWNNNIDSIWVFNDLQQKNLVVGIGFIIVGFIYATHWE